MKKWGKKNQIMNFALLSISYDYGFNKEKNSFTYFAKE